MGLITQKQIDDMRPKWVSVDQNTGNFAIEEGEKKLLFPAITGKLIGFGEHSFERKEGAKAEQKFDIYLQDDEYVYQVQIGYHTWMAFKIMNSLLNVPDIKNRGELMIVSTKKGDNYNINLTYNGEWKGWKYSFEELHLKGKEKDAKDNLRNKIIDKWFAVLTELLPYQPKTKEPDAPAIPAADDDEELPF